MEGTVNECCSTTAQHNLTPRGAVPPGWRSHCMQWTRGSRGCQGDPQSQLDRCCHLEKARAQHWSPCWVPVRGSWSTQCWHCPGTGWQPCRRLICVVFLLKFFVAGHESVCCSGEKSISLLCHRATSNYNILDKQEAHHSQIMLHCRWKENVMAGGE